MRVLDLPTNLWQKELEGRQDLQDLEYGLSDLVQRATLLHGYISHRYTTGCGDQGHEESAKEARKQLVRARRALGFLCPSDTSLRIP